MPLQSFLETLKYLETLLQDKKSQEPLRVTLRLVWAVMVILTCD